MATRLDAQQTAWRTLRDQTAADGTLLQGLAAARQSLASVTTSLDAARTSLADDRTDLAKVLADINDARQEADDTAEDLTSLSDHVTGVEARYGTAQSALAAALTDAKEAASTAQAVDLQQEIKDVAAQGVQSSDDLEGVDQLRAGPRRGRGRAPRRRRRRPSSSSRASWRPRRRTARRS